MLQCIITSVRETKTYDHLLKVTLPAVTGEMQVLTNHADCFASLVGGEINMTGENQEQNKFKIDSGVCYVNDNQVLILI